MQLLSLGAKMKPKSTTAFVFDYGISEKERLKVVESLSNLLADSYTLYLKTHHFHWNVTGPMFQTLHLLFMEQYNEQWLAVDVIAERIRSLGSPSPGTYKQFADLTIIKPSKELPKAKEMVRELLEGQEAVVRTARSAFTVAEKANDQVTCDILTQRMQVHEKNAWMLRSMLEE
jgi:starvation-inducible DNA-binding protein